MNKNYDYFVHKHAICETTSSGKNTKIYAFTHILAHVNLGQNCTIYDHVFIDNNVIIGNRVTIQSGTQIWNGMTIEDDVFIGTNVAFVNDYTISSNDASDIANNRTICKGASIGANSTIYPNASISKNVIVHAGTVVTGSIPPNAIVEGNPAKIIGYTNTKSTKIVKEKNTIIKPSIIRTSVKNVTLHNLTEMIDIRGNLSVGEFGDTIPFKALRYFLVYDVPTAATRGEHAHHCCHQFLIAIKGTIHVVADDGKNREEFVLNRPNFGLYLPPMTWGIQYNYSKDAVLLAFASHHYDANDYIRNYDEFIKTK